jgi:inhibitor of cysteine peptidase
MQILTAADSGQEVSVAVGETIEIELAENPTTGYRWRLDCRPAAVFQSVSDSFQAGKRSGEEGVHRWVLRAMNAGSGKISGQYQRSWAPDAPPARTFFITICVAG